LACSVTPLIPNVSFPETYDCLLQETRKPYVCKGTK